jgi:hypothetical protein
MTRHAVSGEGLRGPVYKIRQIDITAFEKLSPSPPAIASNDIGAALASALRRDYLALFLST